MGARITPIVRNLLILNLAVFFFDMITAEKFGDLFGLRAFNSSEFQPYQLLTYMFVHSQVGIMHILGNMFALFVFGPMLEYAMGQRRFLAFYMLCGLGAGAFNSGVNTYMLIQQRNAMEEFINDPNPDNLVIYLSNYEYLNYQNNIPFVNAYAKSPNDPKYRQESISAVKEWYLANANIPTVGASGSIFGILVAFALLFPNVELFLLFLPFPIKAKYLVGFYIVFELYAGLGYSGASNVAHFAHLGGALIGYLLIRFWNMQRQI